ncbi:MAG: ATP-binding protein [Thermodesulfobacteriota bacterium]|nr:ATP-binding protein [Thermodesulfobacteriota bacterium]
MLEFIRSSYFQTLISSFSSGVVIINTSDIIYVFNEAACRIFRKDLSDCLYTDFRSILPGLDRSQEIEAMIKQVASSWTPSSELTTTLDFQGKTRLHLTISATPLIYHERLFGIFLEIKDVSHIYRFHEKEKQILEEKKAIEQQRTESLKLFSEAVAHQIRNPVTVIGGLAYRLLHNNQAKNNTNEYLAKILESGKRLELIVDAVNQFTSIGGGVAEEVQLPPMLQSIRERLEKEFSYRSSKVTWAGLEDAGTICGSREQLRLTFYEIFRNSLEAMGTGIGLISIFRAEKDDMVLLKITDSGCGIQSSINPFLFDPFFTTHEKAVGMGLCKVRHVMNEHKGTIRLEAGKTGGTTVTLTFPRA